MAEDLPVRTPDRGILLAADAPGGVQVGFTPDEFRAALVRGNPLAREATQLGIVLWGDWFFRPANREDR